MGIIKSIQVNHFEYKEKRNWVENKKNINK
jgi:hypothetical protein